jgi:hypothetical protein
MLLNDRCWRILLQRSFWDDERKFLEPLRHFARSDVGGPYRFIQYRLRTFLHLMVWASLVPPLPPLAISFIVEGLESLWAALATVSWSGIAAPGKFAAAGHARNPLSSPAAALSSTAAYVAPPQHAPMAFTIPEACKISKVGRWSHDISGNLRSIGAAAAFEACRA